MSRFRLADAVSGSSGAAPATSPLPSEVIKGFQLNTYIKTTGLSHTIEKWTGSDLLPPPPELLGCGEIAGILTLKTLNRADVRPGTDHPSVQLSGPY